MTNNQKITYCYFGSSSVSIYVLDELERAGLLPNCVVTTPDKPVGRKLVMTPNVVKEWALKRGIRVNIPESKTASVSIDPTVPNESRPHSNKAQQSAANVNAASLPIHTDKNTAGVSDVTNKTTPLETIGSWKEITEALKKENLDVFIVASFGKIIPKEVVEMPPHKSLNIHPSLLPKYRGPSPLPTAMLDDMKETGVSIMRMDEEMDHGPTIAMKKISVKEWPTYEVFEENMAREGGKLLIDILPQWIDGKINEIEQDHARATYTKKIVKADGEIDLNNQDQYSVFRKIQAFHEWPQAFFFEERNGKKLRIKVTQASFNDGALIIEKVIPEGGKEMRYEDWRRGRRE